MSRKRSDEDIYQFVIANYDPDHLNRTSLERVADGVGLDPYAVRVLAHKSTRLRLRGILLGWCVIEPVNKEVPV